MGEFVILVRDVEECFGGDASDVEAGSPESSSLLDTDGLHSELGSLDRSYISSGSSTDDGKIIRGA